MTEDTRNRPARDEQTDVVIAGGGLAGLTLACQLREARPSLDITVVEQNTFPVPEATAKVGESTVEIGSHYLRETLGLADHFDNHQLRKFGIRCFFGNSKGDFSDHDELGASQTFGIPTYQIDRGRLENHLAGKARSMGVNLVDGSTSTGVYFTDTHKTLIAETDGCVRRWLDPAPRSPSRSRPQNSRTY